MSDEPTIKPMGNPRIDAAAERLNEAFAIVEEKIEYLQSQFSQNPEVDLLEKENMRLHKENADLKDLINEMDQQLAKMEQDIKQMMEHNK